MIANKISNLLAAIDFDTITISAIWRCVFDTATFAADEYII